MCQIHTGAYVSLLVPGKNVLVLGCLLYVYTASVNYLAKRLHLFPGAVVSATIPVNVLDSLHERVGERSEVQLGRKKEKAKMRS